jgi:glycosyltransferase involved in cell wall biosynthesis
LCDISNRTNVLLEAMMCSRCIVTLDDTSTDDLMINGETGFLVPPGDDDALADMIIKLIRNPALRKQVGENAGKKANERLLTWDERGRMEIELVENLVYNGKHKK